MINIQKMVMAICIKLRGEIYKYLTKIAVDAKNIN